MEEGREGKEEWLFLFLPPAILSNFLFCRWNLWLIHFGLISTTTVFLDEEGKKHDISLFLSLSLSLSLSFSLSLSSPAILSNFLFCRWNLWLIHFGLISTTTVFLDEEGKKHNISLFLFLSLSFSFSLSLSPHLPY